MTERDPDLEGEALSQAEYLDPGQPAPDLDPEQHFGTIHIYPLTTRTVDGVDQYECELCGVVPFSKLHEHGFEHIVEG